MENKCKTDEGKDFEDPPKQIYLESIEIRESNETMKKKKTDERLPQSDLDRSVSDAKKPHFKVRSKKKRIEKIDELNRGDHVEWSRALGYSHHAICLSTVDQHQRLNEEEEESYKPQGVCCDDCFKCWWPSKDDVVEVISYTYDEEVGFARVMKYRESFQGVAVYRVEYEHYRNVDETIQEAKNAVINSKEIENCEEMQSSTLDEVRSKPIENYNQYVVTTENCEHFSRRCKTGDSRSEQVLACHRACRKNFFMSLVRMLSLLIWVVCEALIKDHEAPSDTSSLDNCSSDSANGGITKEYLFQLEMHLAFTLTVVFGILYTVYSIHEELKKLVVGPCSYNYRSEDNGEKGKKNTDCNRKSKKDTVLSFKFLRKLKYFAFLFCCQLPYRIILSLCKSACRCTCKNKEEEGKDGFSCKSFAMNYFNVILRVSFKELFAIGVPVAAFYLFNKYPPGNLPNDSRLLAFLGFLFSLVASVPSLVIGACVGGLVEYTFLCAVVNICSRHVTNIDIQTSHLN